VAGEDYEDMSGTLEITAGEQTASLIVTIPPLHDGVSIEEFDFVLSNNLNAALSQATYSISIISGEVVEPERFVANAEPKAKSVDITWDDTQATSYKLYYSSEKGFNPNRYEDYADGAVLEDVTSPLRVSDLTNGKTYYFVLEVSDGNNNARSYEIASRPDELVFGAGATFLRTSALDENSTLYLGGLFNGVGTYSGGAAVVDVSTGQHLKGDFPVIDGVVYSAISDGAEGWYVGGNFTSVGKMVLLKIPPGSSLI
jgi:hypothetical protein